MDYSKLAAQFGGAPLPTEQPSKDDYAALAAQFGGAPVQKPAAPKEGFFSRLAKEPGYLGAAAERGVLGLGTSLQGYLASDIAAVLEARKQKLAEATPEQKADPKWMEARLKEIKEDEEAYAQRVAKGEEYSKRSQAILESQRTRPESRLMFGVGKPERGWKEAASEIGTALVKDPGALVDLALTSGPQMLAMMATTMLARVAGAPTTGAALAGGFTSKEIEFGNEYAENRQEGMSHEDAWNAAQAKSGVVGALDAVSMKTAGKTLDALTDAVKAAKAGHKGAVKTALKETGKEVATQASLGAAGEALGSVAAGKDISPTGVLLEALGETVTAPGEAVVMRRKISRGLEERATEVAPKAEPKAKGKRSAEEAAIDALDQEIIEERKIEDVNKELTEVALEDQQQPPLGGTADLEGVGQPEVGRAGVGVSVPQPPAETPAAADVGAGRLATAERPAVTPAAGTGQPSAPLADEQINNLIDAGFTASQIESGVELVDRLRSRGGLQDVLLTPVARDHAAGLTSEEIAKKNKIDTPLVSAIQVGLGLVPNEKAKPAAVETPAAETPAAETPAVEAPKLGTIEYYREEYRTAPKEVLIEAASDPFGFEPENSVQAAKEELARREKIPEAPAAETPTAETPAAEPPAKPDTVRVYHSGVVGEGESGRWVSTNRTYAADYRPDQPLYYTDIPANDPRVNNPDYENQGAKQGFTFNFELTPQEATTLKEIKREAPAVETPAVETPAAETPTPETEATVSTEPITISKREPVEAPKGVLRSKYTFSDGSTYQIEKRKDEFHLVGVPDENESYLGETRGEAERALNDDKNSGRLDQVVSKGASGALPLEQKSPEQVKGESEYAETQVKGIFEAKLQDFMTGDLVRFGSMSGTVVGLEGDYVRFRPDSATSPKAYQRVPKQSLTLVARPDTTSEVSYSKAQDSKFGEEAGQLNADKGNLIQLLGSNMYQSSLADVTIKELLQNAFDAVKGAVASTNAKGEKITPLYKTGNIEVTIDREARTITIKDDARGMTPEIVRSAFFTIAGSDKSDLPPQLRSGGLGLAKMGFMLGSERLVLDTVRDGVRVKVDTTAKDIASDNFKIVKSPAPKGEHGTTITVKIPEKYIDPRTGDEKDIYFPYSLFSVEPLQKPLIGPVEVKVTLNAFGSPETSTLPVGVNFPENKYTKFTANFDWGSADIYFAVDRNTSSNNWDIKHEVLSSGVYQFAPDFKLNNEKIPYDIIVNVKPNVDARHPDYPFENSRERFKGRLDKDVAALTTYLGQIARGYEAKDLQESFKGVVSMPRVEAGAEIASIADKLKKSFGSQSTGKPAELKPLPAEVTITADKVQDTKTKQILVDVAAKEAEKKKEASFKGEATPKALDFMIELKQDPKLPVFHNNTNVDFIGVGKEYGEPEKFFAELGTLMVEMKEALAKSGMYGYEKLSPENLFFGGVSIDKQYGGVHIRVPYKAVFINPFYDWGARTLFGVGAVLLDTMIHEVAHTGSMDHGVAHNGHMVKVKQYLADEGLLSYYNDAVMDVLRRHESTFTAMREAYGKSTTRNTAKSLEDYGKDTTATSARADRDGREGEYRAVSAGERPGGGEGLRAAAAPRVEGEPTGARGPGSLAAQEQGPTAFDLQSVEPSPSLGGVSEETAQRTPSLKRVVDRLRKLWQAGKITGDEFAGQVNIAANSIENIKLRKPLKKRVRGADYIRERLLKAKREGALSSEAVALAEWFISQNEALVDDLAISIEQPPKRGEGGESGNYNSFMRLMRLIKGAASDTTAIHEILHHLERMMPENIRSGIRREHARQTYNAYKKAKADGNAELVKFFEHVLDFNFGDPTGIGGVESSLSAAIKLIKDGAVPYSFYQYVSPSEFWAVNGTRIVEGKYAAIRGTTLTRLRNWLRNLAQKIKSAFGFSSDAPILRALDSLSKADGKFVTENMLFEETGAPPGRGILQSQEQEPTVLGLHPRVSQALRAGDFNGVFQAIRDTTSGFYAEIARRLVELNLPTAISTGAARARQLTRASIDLVSAPQQNRLFSYVQLTYPDLYNKYFQNYDAEANLERVYEGLKALKKVLPEASPVSAEFKDVLQAYSESIESIDPRTLGFYSPDFDEINIDIDRKGGTSNYVLLHEGVHAATEALITRYETEPETLTAEQRAAAKKLQELFEYTKSVFPGDPNTYGLRNIYEFVAEAFTNRGFQTELKKLEYDFAKPTSVWSRFVSTILKLFGAETVAANVMIEANKLFSASRPRARPALGPMFAKQQKGGPATGGWRTAYDHNTTLIRLFQDAIKGRVPLDTVLKKAAPAVWNTSNYTARQIFLYMAPLRELAISTKSKFPQLTGAIKLVEQMVAYRGQKMKRAEEIVKDWSKLQSERFQQSALLGRIMLSATLQGQDPDTGNGSGALLQAWNALSPDAQSIYRRVRDFYASSIKEMITEMKDRAKANLANDPAALKKALSDIDALFKGIKGPYFPLRRFGDYWFQVGTTDKDKEFYTFESMTDREFAMNERMEELQNGTPAQKKLAETLKLGNSIGEVFDQNRDPTGVLGRVEDLIDSISATTAADVKKELKDSVHQLMYVLLPQQSMKKMFINRKGIQGASADMLRVFSDSAVHSAYQQARFRYSQDFLNNLTNAKDYIGEAQKSGLITPRQRAVYDEFIAEVGTRSGVILSTEDKRLSARAAAAANQTTFFWMLTAPATAMLNVIGATVFGISDMGSKYGYAKTAALLTKNMAKYGASVPTRTIKPLMGKQFLAIDFPSMVEGGSLSPLQSMFAKAFIDAGDINISLTNALFEFGEQPSALYTGRMNTIKKFAAGLFHQAERFNREMVLMTSAELAYNKLLNEPIKDANGIIQRDASGKPLMRTQDATGFSQQAFDDALADARNVAGTALGDFSRAMKSRAMQSPVGSVLFSMKSFAITATFFLMRNVDLSLNRPFRSDELADMRAALLKQNIAPNVVDQRIREAQAELKASYSEARKRMAGVMGITFLFGGLQAQPFFSLALPALVAALKPDDEEEDELFNAENWFRNYMEVNLGGYLGEMAMKLGVEEKTAKKVGREIGEAVSGGIPAAAGVSLTDRVSIDLKDLWYRSPRYSPEYRETVMETIIANAGPAAGLVMNMVDATQLMEQGRYQRAFERALPAIVSNPLKAVRLGKEGAVTKSGATQVEEFTATELAMQALGFQPERLAQKQKSAMEAKTVEMQIKAKRNSVLDRLYLERDSEKGYEYALQMMDEYNKKYPYYAIKPKDISDSFKRKAKASAEAYGIGMAIPKKMRGRLEPMIEYARDEDED